MTRLSSIEGIGPVYAGKLVETGVRSTEALLKQCATKKGRQTLAAATGISEALLLTWTNCADLFRIKGVGSEYAELLEAAGVDTVPELSQRNPSNLYQKMVEVNATKKLVRQLPNEHRVRDWVSQAKSLPRAIEY